MTIMLLIKINSHSSFKNHTSTQYPLKPECYFKKMKGSISC